MVILMSDPSSGSGAPDRRWLILGEIVLTDRLRKEE
jgi:hypothetical protein